MTDWTGTVSRRRFLLVAALAGACQFLPVRASAEDKWTFRVRFSETVRAEPYSGRVYLFVADRGEPREGPDWFQPQPLIAREIEGLRPGEAAEIEIPGGDALTFPREVNAQLLAGRRVQAVMRFNPWEREVGTGAGNGYGPVVTLPTTPGVVDLMVDRLVEPTRLEDNRWCRLFRVRSRLLSDFHGRRVDLQAVVHLPASYESQPGRRFPVIFEIPGFGGALRHFWRKEPYRSGVENGAEFIHVMLDGHGPLGHHEFADSDNNGPYGRALIEEFLPAFEREYRTVAAAHGRLLTGHSSGGWSSLWLQVTYPDVFGGTWSTAPDPVDFRDFQKINVYAADENMFRDGERNRRPLARFDGQPVLWYDDFCRMEDVIGPGGQLHSFEAAFSPRGDDGRPLLLWNRETGAIDPAVAEAWKRYDIRLLLEENWQTLEPKLAGKIHVFMGSQDTFYLDGATVLLKESLERLGSDAVVEIHQGRDHSTLMTRELRSRIAREMSETFLRGESK
jgi:hypothetical protein